MHEGQLASIGGCRHLHSLLGCMHVWQQVGEAQCAWLAQPDTVVQEMTPIKALTRGGDSTMMVQECAGLQCGFLQLSCNKPRR